MNGFVWRCHVCGEQRPDDAISVHSIIRDDGRVRVVENVRYCNDRTVCRRRAHLGLRNLSRLREAGLGPRPDALAPTVSPTMRITRLGCLGLWLLLELIALVLVLKGVHF